MKYSATVIDHFNNPRNIGVLPDANAVGEAVNPVCMDRIKLYLRIEQGVIKCATYQVEGCVPSIAAGSFLTVWLTEQPLERAATMTSEELEEKLGGLPATKKHAAYVAIDALKQCLEAIPS